MCLGVKFYTIQFVTIKLSFYSRMHCHFFHYHPINLLYLFSLLTINSIMLFCIFYITSLLIHPSWFLINNSHPPLLFTYFCLRCIPWQLLQSIICNSKYDKSNFKLEIASYRLCCFPLWRNVSRATVYVLLSFISDLSTQCNDQQHLNLYFLVIVDVTIKKDSLVTVIILLCCAIVFI